MHVYKYSCPNQDLVPKYFLAEDLSAVMRRKTKIEQPKEKRDRALIINANRTIEKLFAESSKKYGSIEYDSAVTIRSWRDSRSKVA